MGHAGKHDPRRVALALVLASVAPAALLELACGARSTLLDPSPSRAAPDAALGADSAAPEDGGADAPIDAPADAPADAPPPPVTCTWSRAATGTQDVTVSGLAVDPLGNVLVLGAFAETADFGLGPVTAIHPAANPYLLELDASGKPLWFRQLGGGSLMYLSGIAVNGSGNILITGILDGPAISAEARSGRLTPARSSPSSSRRTAPRSSAKPSRGAKARSTSPSPPAEISS
jgi:hypothetical protein